MGTFNSNRTFVNKKILIARSEDVDEEVFNSLIRPINSFISTIGCLEKLEGIGIAFAGIMDNSNEKVLYWPNNKKWNGYNLGGILKDYYDTSILFEDDVNSAALGELVQLQQIGKCHKDFIFISIGTGIGCGIIINEKLFKGSNGHAGELGHIIISDQPKCKCGNFGCLQAVISADNILRDYYEFSGIFCGNIEKILEDYNKGSIAALNVVEKYSSILSKVIYNLSMLIGVDTVVLGGGISKALPVLSLNILEKVNKFTNGHNKKIKVFNSCLDEWGGVVGAIYLARSSFNNGD